MDDINLDDDNNNHNATPPRVAPPTSAPPSVTSEMKKKKKKDKSEKPPPAPKSLPPGLDDDLSDNNDLLGANDVVESFEPDVSAPACVCVCVRERICCDSTSSFDETTIRCVFVAPDTDGLVGRRRRFSGVARRRSHTCTRAGRFAKTGFLSRSAFL
jgi:hypothetical protein